MNALPQANNNLANHHLASQTSQLEANHFDTEPLLLNRELGALEFNQRVLAQAADPEIPLLERLRFICIVSSNLDELFEIRVSGLQEQLRENAGGRGPDGLLIQEALNQIAARAQQLVAEQYQLLNESILPALEREGIALLTMARWNVAQRDWARQHFQEQIAPVLTPIGLDPAHPFPRILNKSLNFIVEMHGRDAFDRNSGIAIVQAPRALPRLIAVPSEISGITDGFMMLTSLIQAFVGELFPGMTLLGCHQFRVTRNSDLFVDEEELTNLKVALQGGLTQRHFGDAVRLEVAESCTPEITTLLLREFNLQPRDCYRVNGPVNLVRLMHLPDKVDRPDLKHPSFFAGLPASLKRAESLFDTIRQQDILLHHPYQSFAPVLDFVRSAVQDPNVLAIKQTIYRTGNESELMEMLIAAAQRGKEVTVVLELMARFDEEANINWAARLEEVGAHVVYGIVGNKTHAKMLMIIRREPQENGKLRRYVHLGTGNYHPRTARLYTDFGLFTANENVCADVHEVFQQLTGLGHANKLKCLWQSPFTLHRKVLAAIRQETEHAKQGKPARIIAKMNALLEAEVIRALYTASQAGVQIDLIIRGVCALRPGLPGVSENIRVCSVIGRFLEHSRVYYFHHDGLEDLYLSSADWMDRNLHRRVEIAFPILDAALKKRVIEESLLVHLRPNALRWEMNSEGRYQRNDQTPAPDIQPNEFRAGQDILLSQLGM